MKKIIIICLFLSLLIISIFNVNANILTFPLIGKTIVIDAGHGGADGGAIVSNIKEKDLNLQITYKLKEQLEILGANVLLTRDSDNDLSNPNALYRKKSDFDNRIKLINNSHADMYISIHMNLYTNPIYYGPQVFYSPIVNENKKIATLVQDELNKFANTKRKEKITPNTYMYKRINVKGILIECGFISNKTERNKLLNPKYQKALSITISNAIIKYFN